MYKGYRQLFLTEAEENKFYENGGVLTEDISIETMRENEYLVVYPSSASLENYSNIEPIARYKIVNGKLNFINYPIINNSLTGKIKPKNEEQVLAMEMLKNPDIRVKILTGVYGSGKDFLMINAALELIDQGLYNKIVYVRNNVGVKDTNDLGALPGEELDKILPFLMPFADHVGGLDGLYTFLAQGRLEAQHLGFIRGRDIKNAIILSSEAENLTKEHVQLLLGRVSENSALWLNGDNRQTDKEVFKRNSGLKRAVECLAGDPLCGYIHLSKSERSEVARLADLLDEEVKDENGK